MMMRRRQLGHSTALAATWPKKVGQVVVAGCLVLMLLLSCKEGRPKGVIAAGKMEDILYDYHLTRAIGTQNAGDSLDYRRMEYSEAVFHQHGITRAQFDSSLLWYARHTEELYDIYKNIEKRLYKDTRFLGNASNPNQQRPEFSADGDTANIWQGANLYLLTAKDGNNLMSFSIKADSTYRPGDSFVLRFYPSFIYPEGRRNGVVSLSVRYDNDSVGTVNQLVASDLNVNLTLETVDRPIKRVYGFVFHNAQTEKQEKILLLQRLSLLRIHTKPAEPTEPADSTAQNDSLRAQPQGGAGDSVTVDSLPQKQHSAPVPKKKTLQKNNLFENNSRPTRPRDNRMLNQNKETKI